VISYTIYFCSLTRSLAILYGFCNMLLYLFNSIEILMQTPNSPVAAGSSAGRKTSKRIILVSHGTTQGGTEVCSDHRQCFC
jgi:hypothetical protein